MKWALLALALGACSPPIDPAPARPAHGPEPNEVVEAATPLEPEPPLEAALRAHVEALAGEIGGRGLDRPGTLERSATYIREHWEGQGHRVREASYVVEGQSVANLEIEVSGRRPELVVIGAHYDTCAGNPGADDNASGVAALLELSGRLAEGEFDYGIRFVAFVNEEPPWFRDPQTMGSWVYARELRESGARVVAMLSLESIGYYRDEPGTQHYPPIIAPLYPDTGNFVAVVGKNASRPLVRRVVAELERAGGIAVESIAAPASITGIDWSDHASFWAEGWPQAVMITDTATFRNPHYHQPSDTPDTLDYDRFAALVLALDPTIRALASAEP